MRVKEKGLRRFFAIHSVNSGEKSAQSTEERRVVCRALRCICGSGRQSQGKSAESEESRRVRGREKKGQRGIGGLEAGFHSGCYHESTVVSI